MTELTELDDFLKLETIVHEIGECEASFLNFSFWLPNIQDIFSIEPQTRLLALILSFC